MSLKYGEKYLDSHRIHRDRPRRLYNVGDVPHDWKNGTVPTIAPDGKEQNVYQTRADEKVFDSITEIHSDQIVDLPLAANNVEKLENLGLLRSRDVRELESERLTDATDDFDFVTADDHDHELVFRALDRNERTDTWFSNVEEERADTGIWDPDPDDDGLTDGLEVYWVTSADRSNPFEEIRVEDVNQQGVFDFEKRLGTDPNDNDTDDDGYWDGWIGVYDVGRNDTVVLYMENLIDGGGVSGDEIVQGQIETHDVDKAPSPFGADVDGDGTDEHSYLHLGELFWETDPTDDDSTPSPSMTFEVDYYAGADSALNDSSWLRSIENNYAIYGIDVEMQRDEVLTDDDLVQTATAMDAQGNPVTYDVYNWTEPFSKSDLFAIEEEYHQTSGTQYFFVSSVADKTIDGGPTQTGIHRLRDFLILGSYEFSTVFTDAHQGSLGAVPGRLSLSRDQKMRAVTAKTTVHEIGHVLDLGEEDDRNGEIYSGSTRRGEIDRTRESIENTATNFIVEDWSLMSRGIDRDNFLPPTNEEFTAISIEEWTTMNERLN